MSQITHGIRKVLASPSVYSFFQTIMGANTMRQWLVSNVIKPKQNMNILDIGCGPADILALMNGVNYWGYDISELYISQAKNKYGNRGIFQCKLFTKAEADQLPKFDVVIMIGVLHHLEDTESKYLINLLFDVLKPGGRLITLDACYTKSQNPIAKFLISKDRGQNIRDQNGYRSLVHQEFSHVRTLIRNQTWIPYTHCFMECQK